MFSFPIAKVREIIERGKTDAAKNGGFRNPYYGMMPGEGEAPGVWLVGDHGVYLMANGIGTPGEKPLCEYALECNPETDPDGFHDYKRAHFGGDDGVEYFSEEDLLEVLTAADEQEHSHLMIELTEDSISFGTYTPAVSS